MQNIHEILKAYGLEVPSDKKADFDKAMIDNYRTVEPSPCLSRVISPDTFSKQK
ncbi:MAG: hypothetical protein SOZ34_01340 [Clostridia bacterium]|nr:hypothetical protein [Clostridia bacterium]